MKRQKKITNLDGKKVSIFLAELRTNHQTHAMTQCGFVLKCTETKLKMQMKEILLERCYVLR